MMAAPLVLPVHKPDTRALWRGYDGSVDGVFTDVSTFGGPPGFLSGGVEQVFYDPVLNRGVCFEKSRFDAILFRIVAPLAAERLGDRVAMNLSEGRGPGDFTATDQRIWVPFLVQSASPDEMRCRFLEYDANGLIQLSAAETDGIGIGSDTSSPDPAPQVRSLITDLDATRALWSFHHPTNVGNPGMVVGILQRSGGTLLTTVNHVGFGAGASIDMDGARPLRSNRSIVVFPTNVPAPFALEVQGVAHAGTTPAADGSASQITTNAARDSIRLTRSLDGFGVAKGRFVVGWIDDTDQDVQLRMIQYDGTTLALGPVLDTDFQPTREFASLFTTFNLFELLHVGDGIIVAIATADPTAAGNGFHLIEYNPNDVDDLTLALSPIGLQQVPKDGNLAGHGADSARVFPITRNRFGLAVFNDFDQAVNIKVVHNGGDSIL